MLRLRQKKYYPTLTERNAHAVDARGRTIPAPLPSGERSLGFNPLFKGGVGNIRRCGAKPLPLVFSLGEHWALQSKVSGVILYCKRTEQLIN